jgi:hypothetical protein
VHLVARQKAAKGRTMGQTKGLARARMLAAKGRMREAQARALAGPAI